MVLRNTAEITSAAPATASINRASGSQWLTPKAAIEAPQTMTARMVARPWRSTRHHPAGGARAPTSAPTPGAA